ncbi:MAG TPA: hypothetical protein VJ843_01315 [Candidatus Saccharimonadales bacterium]|nr:hypothetical protein [Candidatus Saccharimonadales bacterium]
MLSKLRMGAVAAVTALALGATGLGLSPAFADDNASSDLTTAQISNALADTGVLADTSTAGVSSDPDSALTTSDQDGTSVDVPKDASDGVAMETTTGDTFSVTPANADDATNSTKVAPGVVAYKDGNTATAVQNTDNGVRMLTIINGSDAPTDYTYNVDLPAGGSITLNDDGSANVLGSDGTAIAYVPTPWAKDANGTSVATYFTTDGTSLTQHVQHNVNGVAYPVTADPWWSFLFTLKTWVSGAKVLAKKIGPWAWALCLTGAGWAWFRSDSKGWVRVGDAVVGCVT